MRRAHERMSAAKPYAEMIARTVGHLADANPEVRHPFMQTRDVKRVAFIIVSSDRGLAGGLNSNLFRVAVREVQTWRNRGVESSFVVFGSKGLTFFKRVGGQVIGQASQLGDKPTLDQLLGPVNLVVKAFLDGEVDQVVLLSNRFVNTMTQKPTLHQVLPIQSHGKPHNGKHWDYLYEPDAASLLDTVLNRYIESQIYQAGVENSASEQSARMVAMKAATDNAGKIISQLQLQYNKARQAGITKELAEIVGGAAAV
jgi:F-type H+-transporting ATPase subunit gamma